MTLVEQLSNLHREIPGCRSVVFGDIQAGTVLRACADDGFHQEDHDHLLKEAATCLGPLAAEICDLVFGGGDSARPSSATLLDDRHLRVFQCMNEGGCDVIGATAQAGLSPDDLAVALRRVAQADE